MNSGPDAEEKCQDAGREKVDCAPALRVGDVGWLRRPSRTDGEGFDGEYSTDEKQSDQGHDGLSGGLEREARRKPGIYGTGKGAVLLLYAQRARPF